MKKVKIRFQKIISLTMALVMLAVMISGCSQKQEAEGNKTAAEDQGDDGSDTLASGESDENTAMGRYAEEEIDMSHNLVKINSLNRLSDGSLSIMDSYAGLWISKDNGASWDLESVPYFNELFEKEIYIMDVKQSSDGTLGIIHDDLTGSDELDTCCVLVKPDGEVIQVELSVTEEDLYPSSIWISDSGRYFVTTVGSNIYEIFEDGSSELFLTVEGRPELISFQDDIMFIDGYDYSEILLYDITKKEYIEDRVLAEFVQDYYGNRSFNGTSFYDLYFFPGEEHVIYLAGEKGLHRHVIGGSAVEQLIDGNLSRLGNPAYGLVGMILLENAEFLAVFNSGKLIRFTYDPNIPSMPSETLKVYSLEESSVLRQAISAYQVANPEVYVEYEVGMEEGSSITRDDALKKLNTKIVSGEGPDVLMMDGLSIDSYVEKGALLNLDEFIEDLCKEEEYYTNMIDALRVDGSAYVIPGQIWLPVVLGKEQYVSQIKDLESMADVIEQMREDMPDKDLLGMISEKEIMKAFAISSAPAWKTGEGKINQEAVKEFLIQTKRIYDAQMDSLDESFINEHNQINEYRITEWGENWIYHLLFYSADGLSYVGGLTQLSFGITAYPYGYYDLTSAAKVKGFEDTMLQRMNGQSSNVYLPRNMMGINAASERTEQAEKFLKLFLSREVQSSLGDYSINKEALDQLFIPDQDLAGDDGLYGSIAMSNPDGLMISMNIYVASEEEIDDFKSWMETADTPYIEDSNLEETVFEEGSQFILGYQSLDEAVDAIEQRLALQMAE